MSSSEPSVTGLSQKEEERIKRSLYKLHAATGHGSTRHLVTALRRRGASDNVLRLAQDFSCPICDEKRHVTPRHVASLEPLPPRWSTLAGDVGDWRHPNTGEHVQFLLLIDENSRYRVARILTRGAKQTPSAAACLHYMREGWIQYFGEPQTLRLDPAGAFRSKALEEFADRHHIYLDIIPGEAHWQMSACEGAIKGVKEVMSKLADEDDQITPEEALATAILTFNQRDVIRGFSPMQLAFGCGRDATGRMTQEAQQLPEELHAANASGEFQNLLQRQAVAEKAMVDWRTKERLNRAQHSRPQPTRSHYAPGDLVFYWRTQESGQGKKKPGSKQGRFLGPARVLATETKRDSQGDLRPGSSIWCVRGRTLIKCAPEQLRPASHREELVEAMVESDGVPWTFTRVAQSIGGNQYEDVGEEIPSVAEWQRAQDIQRELPPTRRISMKRPGPSSRPPTAAHPDAMDEDLPEVESSPQRPRTSASPKTGETASQHWTETLGEEAFLVQESSYWSEETAAVTVEVDVPASQRGLQAMSKDLTHFFVGAFKRRAVEVCERKLSPQDLQKFREAKEVEVKNFIAAKAFEAIPVHLRPSKEQAVGMRWILTWKLRDDGSYKAKARAVLLGYQDPSYEHRATTAPVMTRQTRQMMLQAAAMHQWRLRKGDVSGAFLQGREYPDVLHCIPCDEICSAMGLEKGAVTRLRKACYGLVDAPLEWYRTVATYLEQLGLQRLWSDACAWVWRPQGQLRGMISGHVDDFLFGGRDDDKEWQNILDQIKAKFKWGDWEEDSFVQCGVLIRQTEAGFELSQEQYIDSISEIPVGAVRRRDKEADTTEREKGQLRALLGSLSWCSQQTAPHLSAEVSLLLSEVGTSKVGTILRANTLLSYTKARRKHKMLIHKFGPQEQVMLFAWVDAASQNRCNGGSTQGIFVGFGTKALLEGELGRVTPVSWHSTKVDRACRSPGAAETLAATNGEDALYFARYQWSEILFGEVDVRRPNRVVAAVDGCVITDSRNVYDKFQNEVIVIKGAEKRSDIEMLGLKESEQQTGLKLRWVHSEAQLANSLTKAAGGRELELYYRMQHCWKIVEDPMMQSARKRRVQGPPTALSGTFKACANYQPPGGADPN
ncbi:Copia protein [Symbiodinium microadriaticum]|uniref:Copia protein n=1 Tax=Symbiodinium microadriaticum TaxID=2951 RepID=A0A1Q9DI40_SYMMI|nr:Copia protein [Symbiodinium microadriaticum]